MPLADSASAWWPGDSVTSRTDPESDAAELLADASQESPGGDSAVPVRPGRRGHSVARGAGSMPLRRRFPGRPGQSAAASAAGRDPYTASVCVTPALLSAS
jgi:hypothetical protein